MYVCVFVCVCACMFVRVLDTNMYYVNVCTMYYLW